MTFGLEDDRGFLLRQLYIVAFMPKLDRIITVKISVIETE